jgi:hypothetical protein
MQTKKKPATPASGPMREALLVVLLLGCSPDHPYDRPPWLDRPLVADEYGVPSRVTINDGTESTCDPEEDELGQRVRELELAQVDTPEAVARTIEDLLRWDIVWSGPIVRYSYTETPLEQACALREWMELASDRGLTVRVVVEPRDTGVPK